MSIFEDVEITTDLGKFNCAVTEADHVSITPNETIIYKGSKYHIHLHLYRDNNGDWAPRPNERTDVYIDRGFNKPNTPPTHRKYILNNIVEAWNKYYKGDPDISRRAELKSLRSKLITQTNKYTELSKELHHMGLDIEDIKNKINLLEQ